MGMFCRGGRAYDAKLEMETMIQCVACEVRSSGLRDACTDLCISSGLHRIGSTSLV